MLVQALRSASRSTASRTARPRLLPYYPIASRSYAKYNGPPFNDRPKGQPQDPLAESSTSPQKDQRWSPETPIKFQQTQKSTSNAGTAKQVESSSKQTEEYNPDARPSANTVPDGQPGPAPAVVDPARPTPGKSAGIASSTRQTGEFNEGADPAANTVSDRQPGPQSRQVDPVNSTPRPSQGYDSAKQTEEFNTKATPVANTVPSGQPGPQPTAVNPSDSTPNSHGVSEAANEELRGPKESDRNTSPTTESEQEPPSGPLPDLRQGIPSTFAKEFGLGGTSGQQAQGEQQDAGADSFDAATGGSDRARRIPEEEEFDQSDYETSTDRARAKLARYAYASLLLALITGSAYFGRPYDRGDDAPIGLNPSDLSGWGPGAIWARIRSRMTGSVEYYTEPTSRKLLPEVPEGQRPPYTLVLSLEDLLIHSEWTREHGWRTAKRPGVDYFLRYLNQYFELVVFTSVPYAMGEPVIRKLDPFRIIMWPLFREATKFENGKYIKDLAYLNRPLEKTLIIDTNADAVSNQPDNAIVLPKWKGDGKDPNVKDLVALIPFLEYIAATNIPDVRKVIKSFEGTDIPQEFARREAIQREEFAKRGGSRPKASLGGFLSSSLGMKATPAPGSMILGGTPDAPGQTVSEGLAQGKMLIDQIRAHGQAEYRRLEEEIRKNGDKWLKDMEEEEKKMMENSMKDMKKGWFGSFAGGSSSGQGKK